QLLAHVELQRGNPEEALELVQRGQALAVRAGGAEVDGYFEIAKAQALAQLGHDEDAVACALALAARARAVRSRRRADGGTRPRGRPLDLLEDGRAARGRGAQGRGARAPEEGGRAEGASAQLDSPGADPARSVQAVR